jgi:heme a synthase
MNTLHPVPKFVRIWAILTLTLTLLLLFVLGGFVTSFRVGMADRVWPTEPWYLVDKDWSKLEFGFLIEHTHRAAGWVVGILVSLLALFAWYGEPRRALRYAGIIAILVLLVSYGEFHRGMMKAYSARESGTPVEALVWPINAGYATLGSALLCLLMGFLSLASTSFGKWARTFAMLTLIGVMIQGLLGGFRVFLDQLFGTQLAAYHGVFAQIVLGVMMATVALMSTRRSGDSLHDDERTSLGKLAIALPMLLYVQLVWAAWVRHLASPLAQRLHILTAFLITGILIWFAVRALRTENSRKQLGFLVYHLIGILVLQLILGVEAYLAKFAAVGEQFNKLPLDRIPHSPDAAIRTLHSVLGAALLAACVVIAIRVNRRPLQSEQAVYLNSDTRRIEAKVPAPVA